MPSEGAAPDGGQPDGGHPDVRHAERVLRALAGEVTASTAAAALRTGEGAVESRDLLDPGGKDARPSRDVIQLGWEAGGRAFETGLSVHHVVRDADLLLAIILADLERQVETLAADVLATPATTLGVARRLQRAMGRYTQAAASGFVHALLRNIRERYRLLRHDLRNPLGTIRSALSLMEDESVPEEMRHGPGIRSMVARNAGSLDQLIGTELDDAAATSLLVPPQDIALRDVALAARREVREAARLAGCAVIVDDVPEHPPSYIDPAALELTLTALLLAGLSYAGPGDALRIDCANRGPQTGGGGSADGRPCAVMRVSVTRAGSLTDGASADGALSDGTPPTNGAHAHRSHWDPVGLALAASLAADHGGSLGANPAGPSTGEPALLADAEALYLHLPLSDDGADARVAAADPATAGSAGHA